MQCNSCGAAIKIQDEDAKYIECGYCGRHNSNFAAFSQLNQIASNYSVSIDDTKLLELMLAELNQENYEQVKALAKQYLVQHPNSWLALTYLALSMFWTGDNDFGDLEEIFILLEKAQQLSPGNALTDDAREKIANNTILLATKNEHFGSELSYALKAIQLVKSKAELTHDWRKSIAEYIALALSFIKESATADLSQDRVHFDTKLTRLEQLHDMVRIEPENTEAAILFCLLANIHATKNPTKSYLPELKLKIAGIRDNIGPTSDALLSGDPIDNLARRLGNGKSGCFIATAALGAVDSPVVVDLRKFRDTHLSSTALGQCTIELYYRLSPPLAASISKHQVLKLFAAYTMVYPLHSLTQFYLKLKRN